MRTLCSASLLAGFLLMFGTTRCSAQVATATVDRIDGQYVVATTGVGPGEVSVVTDGDFAQIIVGGVPTTQATGFLYGVGREFIPENLDESTDRTWSAFPRDGGATFWLEGEARGRISPGGPVLPDAGPFATAFFPFADGWIGAHLFDDPQPNGDSTIIASGNLPAGSAILGEGSNATIDIGLTPEDGLLFAISGDDEDQFAAASYDAALGAWRMVMRDNQNTDPETFEGSEPGSFLFVPFDTPGLIAAHIDVDDSLGPQSAVDSQTVGDYTLERIGVGTYELSIGDGSEINPETAILMLINGDQTSATNSLPEDNYFGYEASSDGSSFVIYQWDLDNSTLEDSDFRFAVFPHVRPQTVIPEPASGSILALATGSLLLLRRRK